MKNGQALPYYTNKTMWREPTDRQRCYYDFRVIDSLIAILQATGETRYLDEHIWSVDRVKSLATRREHSFYDRPMDGRNVKLYDGHGMRAIPRKVR